MQQRKKPIVTFSLILGGVLLVTACQKTNEPSLSADVSEQTRTAEGMSTASQDRVSQNNLSENEVKNNPNIIKTNYQCDQGKMVVAIYNNSNINSPRVTLTIDGRRFEMYNVIASSGTLYATEQGINAGQGMRWHVHGLEAILQTMTLDHTADPAKETMLMRCQEPL